MDWDLGEYERIAEQLLPAAHVVVEEAGPLTGEHVVDIGCGTGNASLLAAARGARVTGIDPAPRLIEVARASAAAQDADASFLLGEAGEIPLPDSTADAVLSVFGVIFAPDAGAAAEEMARITSPGGRIVLSAWVPQGAIADAMRVRAQAIAADGAPGDPPPFAWHEAAALRALLARRGFTVAVQEAELGFTASSPEEFLDRETRSHPVWIASRATLETRGLVKRVRERMLEIFTSANEDPSAFLITSRYVVATARRPAPEVSGA